MAKKPVGVAFSYDVYAPLVKRVTPCYRARSGFLKPLHKNFNTITILKSIEFFNLVQGKIEMNGNYSFILIQTFNLGLY